MTSIDEFAALVSAWVRATGITAYEPRIHLTCVRGVWTCLVACGPREMVSAQGDTIVDACEAVAATIARDIDRSRPSAAILERLRGVAS